MHRKMGYAKQVMMQNFPVLQNGQTESMFAIIPITSLNYKVEYQVYFSFTHIEAVLFLCFSVLSCLSIRFSRDQESPLVHQIAIWSPIMSKVSKTMFIFLSVSDCELALFVRTIEIGPGFIAWFAYSVYFHLIVTRQSNSPTPMMHIQH